MFRKSNKVLDIFEKQLCLYDCRSIQSKKKTHTNRKFGSHCFYKIKKPNKNFLKFKCDWWCLYFDMTDNYCTLSMYITPKTISRQNQKTNTTPQLYCTLRPVLLQDYFGTISGIISSNTNSTKIVPETSNKMAFFEEVSGTILVLFVVLFLWCVHVL